MKNCENKQCPKWDNCNYKIVKATSITMEELQLQIENALKKLYYNENYLIEHNVHEVAIVTHFFRYFLNEYQEFYYELNIDMEYNKNGVDPKYYYKITGEEVHRARPDFIIHKRGCNSHNLLYIEFKHNKNRSNPSTDFKKIKAFTSEVAYDKAKEYHYKYGLAIRLYLKKVEMIWFQGGVEIPNGRRVWHYTE